MLPEAEVVLSLDAQSRYDTAYQLTRDALTVHQHINLAFAINDTTAWGAINACNDLRIDRREAQRHQNTARAAQPMGDPAVG